MEVKGFKLFDNDWIGIPDNGFFNQYYCPGKFEEDASSNNYFQSIEFCENLVDCFKYYNIDTDNRVAEVIAYGDINKYEHTTRTNKLEIVREIPWDEVLRLINTGKGNVGKGNVGCKNTGYYNDGNHNTGEFNTGSCNAGSCNAGNCNTGICNAGYKNTGDRNTGDNNTGNYNSGYNNAGNYNSGYKNTGSGNSGYKNAGNCNSGNYNTGDWNTSSFNTGLFNTEESKIRLFNKPSAWTYNQLINSEAYKLIKKMPNNIILIKESKMSNKEKTKYSNYLKAGKYLKMSKSEGTKKRQEWWDNLSDSDKGIIKALPNFDAEIFKQITGIIVD